MVETPDFTSNFAGHQPHFSVAAAAMSLEAAPNLSVPELLRVLNEKLGLECTRAREIRFPPVPGSVNSLSRAQVSINPVDLPLQAWWWDLTYDPPDRKPQSQSERNSGAHPFLVDPVAPREQASTRDPLPHRLVHGTGGNRVFSR